MPNLAELPKEDVNYGDRAFEDLRKTLLDQYHLQTMTHAGYILALIIGMLTIIANFNPFFEKGFTGVVIFCTIISLVLGTFIFFVGRLCFYTNLVNIAIGITQPQFEKYYNEHNDEYKQNEKGSCIGNLYQYIFKAKSELRKQNKGLMKLANFRSLTLVILSIVAFSISFVIFMILIVFLR